MAERFVNITKDQMEAFLSEQGFQQMKLPNVNELVYGRVYTEDGHKVSLRILTAINPTGESRKKGSDAIRVQLWYRYNGKAVMVGRQQKCLRTKGWRLNILKAIESATDVGHWKICPKCGSPMVDRKGKNGKFWACVTYFDTKCNGKPEGNQTPVATVTHNDAGEVLPNSSPKTAHRRSAKPKEKPLAVATSSLLQNVKAAPKPKTGAARYQIDEDLITEHQLAARKAYLESDKHILMGARAGCGKTAMVKDLSSFRKDGQSMVYLVFAKRNARQAWKEMPRGITACTSHSFCIRWLRNEMTLPEKSDEGKTYKIMEKVYPALNNKDRKRIRKSVFRMVGLAKNWACRPNDLEAIRDVMDKYKFELDSDGEYQTVVEVTNEVLEASLPTKCGLVYNYDDMLWWPVVLDMQPPHYDDVLLDEVQDFNACQRILVERLEAQGSRITAVGDPYQAVFRFRGADNESFNKMFELLSGTERGCEQLLLPDNFRCCIEIIEWLVENTIVKDIRACKTAGHGRVREDMTYNDVLDLIVSEFGKTA